MIPYFTLEDTTQDTAVNIIQLTAKAIGPFVVKAGEEALYGPDNNIAVNKLSNPGGLLKDLHTGLIECLGLAGCHFMDLTYALENYSTHISHKDGRNIPTTTFVCNSLTIAQKLSKSVPNNKVILERIDL